MRLTVSTYSGLVGHFFPNDTYSTRYPYRWAIYYATAHDTRPTPVWLSTAYSLLHSTPSLDHDRREHTDRRILIHEWRLIVIGFFWSAETRTHIHANYARMRTLFVRTLNTSEYTFTVLTCQPNTYIQPPKIFRTTQISDLIREEGGNEAGGDVFSR